MILDSVNGVSSTKNVESARIEIQSGEIREIKFVEDDTLMFIWSNGGKYLSTVVVKDSSPK